MLTLNRGRATSLGTESMSELLMMGFWPSLSVDASRHSAPLPDKSAPVMWSLRSCSTSVGFKMATVRARRSLVQAAHTSDVRVHAAVRTHAWTRSATAEYGLRQCPAPESRRTTAVAVGATWCAGCECTTGPFGGCHPGVPPRNHPFRITAEAVLG